MTRLLTLCLVVGTLGHVTLAVEPDWHVLPGVVRVDPHGVIRAR